MVEEDGMNEQVEPVVEALGEKKVQETVMIKRVWKVKKFEMMEEVPKVEKFEEGPL